MIKKFNYLKHKAGNIDSLFFTGVTYSEEIKDNDLYEKRL
jgi:hypothetical protein